MQANAGLLECLPLMADLVARLTDRPLAVFSVFRIRQQVSGPDQLAGVDVFLCPRLSLGHARVHFMKPRCQQQLGGRAFPHDPAVQRTAHAFFHALGGCSTPGLVAPVSAGRERPRRRMNALLHERRLVHHAVVRHALFCWSTILPARVRTDSRHAGRGLFKEGPKSAELAQPCPIATQIQLDFGRDPSNSVA